MKELLISFVFLTFLLISCKTNRLDLNSPTIGKVISSTYQITNYSNEERGYTLQIELKKIPNNITFNQIIFRKKVAKSVTVTTNGNKTLIHTYLPLVSRKVKTYQIEKVEKPDGLTYSYQGNTYFYPINFELKL